MSPKLNSMADYGQAAVDLVNHMLAKGYQDGEILDICKYVPDEIGIRCDIATRKKWASEE